MDIVFIKTKEEYQNALKEVYLKEVVPAIKEGLCASIYTQVSDVEDEMNGLLTYDRKVVKVDSKVMSEIACALKIE